MENSIIKIDGKPIEKLIEVVSAGISTIYKPRAIRNEADAEAYKIEKLAEANAKGLVAEMEIITRAKQRLLGLEVTRQINIETTVGRTFKYLKETVSDQSVDIDWRTKFFNKVQDISGEEMQEIWAKILAQEITEPGKISLRTLDLLANLSRAEAKLFQKAAEISFSTGGVLNVYGDEPLNSLGINYDELLVLLETGLVHSEADSMQVALIPEQGLSDVSIVAFGEKKLLLKKPGHQLQMVLDHIKFTQAGKELVNLLNVTPNYKYLTFFKKALIARGWQVNEVAQ